MGIMCWYHMVDKGGDDDMGGEFIATMIGCGRQAVG